MAYQGAFLHGNFVELQNAVLKLRKLKQAGPKLAQAAAPKLRAEVMREFAQGRDPYGKAWKPLAAATLRKHGPPPLTHTGAMKSGIVSRAMASAIKLSVPHPGFLHQYGWRRRLSSPRPVMGYIGGERRTIAMQTHGTGGPARPILPSKGRMPSAWKDAVKAALRSLLEI